MDNVHALLRCSKSRWVFYLEEDWQFVQPHFIEKSMTLMTRDFGISTVRLTGPRKPFGLQSPVHVIQDIPYRYTRYKAGPGGRFGGFSFNPGLWRRNWVLTQIHPQPSSTFVTHESRLSHKIRARTNKLVACLQEQYVRHIGAHQQVRLLPNGTNVFLPSSNRWD